MATPTGNRAGLALGPQVRSRRAALKRAMADDVRLALEIVAGRSMSWEKTAAAVPIESLLAAVPGVGTVTIDRVLDGRRIPPAVQAFGLTAERRAEIAAAVAKELGL